MDYRVMTPEQLEMPVATRREAYARIPHTCDLVKEILEEATHEIINRLQLPNEEYAALDAAMSAAFHRIRDEVTQPFRTEQMRLLALDWVEDEDVEACPCPICEGVGNKRPAVERQIAGALKVCIDAHGPITPERLGSAVKRVVGALKGMNRVHVKEKAGE